MCVCQTLRHELEVQYKRGRLSLANVQSHDAATLLKQFLRELPTPLLTIEYLEAFAQVNSESPKFFFREGRGWGTGRAYFLQCLLFAV